MVQALTTELSPDRLCFYAVQRADQGKTVTAKVVDLCPSCTMNGIDLSTAAFQALAPLEQGIIQVVWGYV